MKKSFFTLFSYMLIMGMLFLISCQNVESYKDVVYFTGTESTPIKRVSTEEPTSIGLSVTSSCKVEEDVKIGIKISPEKVDAFNKKEGVEYKLLPENLYQLSSKELKIEIGDNVSKPFELIVQNIEDFEPEVTYLLPISIDYVEGGLDVLETSRTIYVIISTPLITNAVNLNGKYYKIPFEENESPLKFNQLSYEARVRVHQFCGYEPYISSVVGIEGVFLLRFGDVTIKPNQIQITGVGVETTAPTELVTEKWYHFAAVFDGSNVKIYIDGKLDVSKPATATVLDLRDEAMNRGFYIGRSYQGRLLNGDISEVRVWNRALTQKEILNNMCGVRPTSEGLLAYWRFNEGEGELVQDVTGHGWDISGSFNWIEGIRCPNE